MKNQHSARKQELFLAALGMAEADREAWLKKECRDDQALFDEVWALIDHDRQCDDPLEAGINDRLLSHAGLMCQKDGLHVRCPHCRNAIEITADDTLSDVVCRSCGSSFSLLGNKATETNVAESCRSIAQFSLIERIGTGHFGTVWKARDQKLDRFVAVKIPRKGQLNPAEAEKFFREARAAAQLRHANIVPVYEVGRDNESVFIVSEYIPGATLRQWLTSRRMTSLQAAELCEKLADALHHAHQLGVIHRDLKPSNIMMDGEGEPHIMDFGLAKREAGEITMTMDGAVLGTPAYMPPEQAAGRGHLADARSDVYALGVILFELLTGALPFRGQTQMLLVQILNDDPPPPRSLNHDISRDLETICLKCLEKDPRRRYQSSKELADELRKYLGGETISARPVSRPERLWRWCKRKPGPAAAWGTALVLLFILSIGGPVVAFQQQQIAQQEKDFATQEHQFAVQQKNYADKQAALRTEAEAARKSEAAARKGADRSARLAKAERDAKARQLYLAHMNIAHQEWLNRHAARTRELLNLYLPKNGSSEDYRDWEWNYLHRLSHAELSRIESTPPEFKSDPNRQDFHLRILYSPDGRFLLTASHRGELTVWTPDGSKKLRSLQAHTEAITGLDVSGDGRFVVSASGDQRVKLWRTKDWTVVREFPGIAKYWNGIAVSPQGDRLAVGNGEIVVYDIIDGGEILRLPGQGGSVKQLTFSLTGDRLVSRSNNYVGGLWDLETGQELHRFHSAGSISISPNAEMVVTGTQKGEVIFWNAESGKQTAVIAEHEGAVKRISFNADGSRMATAGNDTVVKVWDVYSRRVIHSFYGHDGPVTDVTFSLDSDRIASCGWDLVSRVWDTASRHELMKTGPNRLNGIRFSPDGRSLAVSTGKKLMLYDFTSRQLLWERTEPAFSSQWASPVEFDASGDLIASGRSNGTIVIYESPTGHVLQTMQTPDGGVSDLLFLSDGRLVTGSQNGRITIWSRADVAYSEDSKMSLINGRVGSLAVSPDEKLLAVAGDDADVVVHLWDLEEQRVVRTLTGHQGWAFCLDFSRDGRRLICGGRDDSLAYWDVASGKLIRRQRAHSGSIYGIDFSDDGRRIASCSEDGNVKFWDEQTGMEVITLKPGLRELTAVSFSPDGAKLAVSGHDGGFVIYDSRPLTPESRGEAWVETLRSDIAFRSLNEKTVRCIEKGDLASAIEALEQLGEIPGYQSDNVALRDLYARTMQWEKALIANRALSTDKINWQEVALLYLLDRHEEYRGARRTLLAESGNIKHAWLIRQVLIACLLLPLEAELHADVHRLAEKLTGASKPWDRDMVGKAMYRLDEFDIWFAALPDESPLKNGHDLRLLISAFQKDPSEENRRRLKQFVQRCDIAIQNRRRVGDVGRYWHDFVQDLGWVREAKRVMQQ